MASILEQARERVRATGARVTAARVKVLAVLLQADEALMHTEVQRRLEQGEAHDLLDRVTLYRVLEWLVEAGLAHRVSGPDRVWRFSAHGDGAPAGTGHAHGAQHGHFKCRRCDRMFCMKSSSRLASTVRGMLPDGFDGDAVELTVVGRCAECAAAESGAPHAHAAGATAPHEHAAEATAPHGHAAATGDAGEGAALAVAAGR
ncbi:MAG: transcriptional repressor [Burkholderiales bacterium]|nr:MAG: transcriptional repressor [Burkholderiales bacterium]